MKIKVIAVFATFLTGFASCTKCVTCVAYYSNGTVSSTTQSVKECNKEQINAYETGTNYTDPSGTPVRFKCK